jgi:hypothetical protein
LAHFAPIVPAYGGVVARQARTASYS